MSNERAIPRVFATVHERRRTPWVAIICTTVIALALASWSGVRTLGGTTALLLLCVFAVVNAGRAAAAQAARSRTRTIGRRRCAPCSASCLACIWRRRFAGREAAQYVIAGVLLLIGIALFVINALLERRIDRVSSAG